MRTQAKVRVPEFDWENGEPPSRPADLTYSYGFVASSIMIAAFEPFIVRVTKRIVQEASLPEGLRRDAENLIGQEDAHGAEHRMLNRFLESTGIGGTADESKRIVGEFSSYFREKSLRYCSAYCAAFELLGLVFCDFYFHDAEMQRFHLSDGDPAGRVWHWHFAEEYEHRAVAHDLYDHCFPSKAGYLFRIRVTGRVLADMFRWSARLVAAMKAFDVAELPSDVAAAHMRQHKRYEARWGRFFMTRVARVLAPGYRPGSISWPDVEQYLDSLPKSWSLDYQ